MFISGTSLYAIHNEVSKKSECSMSRTLGGIGVPYTNEGIDGRNKFTPVLARLWPVRQVRHS